MLDVLLLRDIKHGGDQDQASSVAARFAAFLEQAKHSLDLAIYDFRLSPALAEPVVTALTAAAGRGVQVRLAYDAGKPAEATQATFAALAADPAPVGTADWVKEHFDGTAVRTKAITAPSGQLMHSKYIVRDVGHRHAAVWTGSANWTDDAWSRQENNLLTIPSSPLAAGYRADLISCGRPGASPARAPATPAPRRWAGSGWAGISRPPTVRASTVTWCSRSRPRAAGSCSPRW
ncbi:phospholipase D-like domain-containing protein [Actinoplanes sp. NPDC051411]|uniref:phospholipase D-like domain-containing protein n=1 Tax=Actinoplanes sp. NPDC051411 TaxID=3155522 RepID=UPI003427FDE0